MKNKKIILSVFSLMMCFAVLIGVCAPKKKPIFANEMKVAYAEKFFELFDDEEQEFLEDRQEENQEENILTYSADEEENTQTCVSVYGQSTLSLSPDKATITACIEKFNEDMKVSREENLKLLDEVMDALKEKGISEDKLKLQYFNSHPSYDYSIGHQPIGYYSKSCFSFEIEDLDQLTSYINILNEKQVSDIWDICYSVSNIEEQYNQALTQAIENAKTKAQILLNCDNLEICKICEERVYSFNNLCKAYVENLSSALIGKVEIEASVIAEFQCA